MYKPGITAAAMTIIIWLLSFNFTRGQEIVSQQEGVDTVLITGVGDIMLGTSFPNRGYLPPGDDPSPLLKDVAALLHGSDIIFGNLEGPFLDEGKLAKNCRDTTRCYAFRVPEKYSAALGNAGFNLLSLANNHIGDFGEEGKERTMALLDSMGIHYAGPTEFPYSIFELDSVVYGFCAFAPNKGVLNVTDIANAKKVVTFLHDTCDIVIVSMHAGAEGAEFQHVTRQEEEFYGENRGNVYLFAHEVIDAGADLVFGHGPHVTRAVEVYRERFIAYSLGNFCTYRRFNLSGPNGYAPIVRVSVDRDGRFLQGEIIPVYQDNMGHVRPDMNGRALNRIRELVLSDFPETGLTITDNGRIFIMDNYGK